MNLYFLSGLFLMIFGIITFAIGLIFINYNMIYLLDWELVTINSSSIVFTMLFDWMSLIFISGVLMISSMVVFYSNIYMLHDKYNERFLMLVLMFILSMLLMIVSPNLISILLGWDGLGLVSYSLVVYFNNYNSYSAGMLTILSNRLGDVAILISIFWMLNFGSWNFIYYLKFWDMTMYYNNSCIGIFHSSAQIPFSSWLPAAMAAPTPVSALVHSSTLVTAGVYLLIRFSHVFVNLVCSILLLFSMMTMFMSGVGACFEYDLKKIIALSTLSQLGLMMSILFLGFPILAFFHLLVHAFFSALLFLCAGLIIHVMSDSQDIRHMGGVINYIPYTCACFCISNMALCGFPFMSGFYSKDMIVEHMTFYSYNFFVYLIFYVSIGLTVLYTVRMLNYVMCGKNMYCCQSYYEDLGMILPMLVLVILSVLSGCVMGWLIFSFPVVLSMSLVMSVMPLLFLFVGAWLGYELFVGNYMYSMSSYYLVSYFLGSMWFMPSFSTYMLNMMVFKVSNNYMLNMDYGWGESVVSDYLFKNFVYLSSFISFYEKNSIKFYMITYVFILFIFII
nr:NADH dehydrogenase subunit 5 [Scotomedes sp. HL-2012]